VVLLPAMVEDVQFAASAQLKVFVELALQVPFWARAV